MDRDAAVNRSKAKGTAAESAVVRYANMNGYPFAERRPLSGAADRGDILLCPGVIIEVKAGKTAQTASLGKVNGWLAETKRERDNAGAAIGILVIQRQGYGLYRVGDWEAWSLPDDHHEWLTDVPGPVMLAFGDALERLRAKGWG